MGVTSGSNCTKELKLFLLWQKKKWEKDKWERENNNTDSSWGRIRDSIREAFEGIRGDDMWKTEDEEEDPPNPLPCYVAPPEAEDVVRSLEFVKEERILSDIMPEIVESDMTVTDPNIGRNESNPIVLRFDCKVGVDVCVESGEGITYSIINQDTWKIIIDINSLDVDFANGQSFISRIGEPENGKLYFKVLPPTQSNTTRGITG